VVEQNYQNTSKDILNKTKLWFFCFHLAVGELKKKSKFCFSEGENIQLRTCQGRGVGVQGWKHTTESFDSLHIRDKYHKNRAQTFRHYL